MTRLKEVNFKLKQTQRAFQERNWHYRRVMVINIGTKWAFAYGFVEYMVSYPRQSSLEE